MQRFFKTKTAISSGKTKSFHDPPIKVIRALSDFTSTDKSKLSFSRGDYFYVTSFDLQSPNLYYVVNPLTNLCGLVDSVYFENVDRKTHLPSPLEDELNHAEAPIRRSSSKSFFNNPFRGKLRTGQSKKGSVTSIVTSYSVLSPDENAGYNINDAEYNRMFYSDRFDTIRNNGKASPINSRIRESPLDLVRQESQSETYSGFSLLQVEHITVLGNMNDKFSIILKCDNGRSRMIHRSYSELYAFHFQLLEMFPNHTGVDFSPRIIPYLAPLSSDDIANINLRKDLETYILESKYLPSAILTSRHWTDFLKLRSGDEELGETDMNDENSVLDLIAEYNQPTIVKIKISISTGQTYSFRAEKHSSYRSMVKSLESRLNHAIGDLLYWNENKQLTKIHGDQDLQLLFRTCPRPTLYSK